MKSCNKLMAVGLNPALQKQIIFPEFKEGQVNRADSMSYIPGGKAANFAKAANKNGTDTVIYQFSGGSAGEKYRKILDKENLKFVNQLTKVETRTCSTLISKTKHKVTEIIEPSGIITEDEAKKLLAQIIKDLPEFQGIALCGTFPPGIKPKFYAKIAEQALKYKIPLLMDACINIESVLKESIEILKINLDELNSLTKCKKTETAANAIFAKYNVKILAITDGPKSAHLFLRNEPLSKRQRVSHYVYSIPKLKKVLNPIGAGDTVSAVLLSEYIKGSPVHEAFKTALAAGSASCMNLNNADFDLDIVQKLATNDIKLNEQ